MTSDSKLDHPPYKTEILGRGLTPPPQFSTSDYHQFIIIPRGFAPGDYTIRVTDANGKLVNEKTITIR